MSVVLTLMRTGFTEARRNRVTVVVGVFAAVLILLTTVVLNTTVFTLDRAVTNFGLAVMSLLLVCLSVFLSVGMLSREIERRTVFLVMSRPLSRGSFVLGRYLGMVLTLTVLLVAMTVIYVLQLLVFEVPLTSSMFAAIVGLWVELWVLSAIGLFFSSFTGPVVATVSVSGLYFIGHLAPELYQFSLTAPGAFIRAAARVLYYALPNLDRFDFRVEAAHASAIELNDVLSSVGFGMGWAAVFLVGAMTLFARRDFR